MRLAIPATAIAAVTLLSSVKAFFAPPEEFMEHVMDKTGEAYCTPSGRISETCCDYETVEDIANKLAPVLFELVQTPFFRYAKLNLNRGCQFWPNDGRCVQRECVVQTTDEEDIPEKWRSSFLSAVDYTPVQGSLPFKKCSISDKDFCVLDDEATMDGPYVDLLRNPERFTGYAGDGSWRIWKAIYQENCFDMVSETGITRGPFAESPHEGNQLHQLLRSLLGKTDRGSEEVCKEKRVFYRIISGLHASISIHICDEFFNRTTGEWEHNLDCFITRIGKHPERLQNVYFNYVLLLRAVTKMAPFLEGYTFCTGDQQEDHRIKTLLNTMVQSTLSCPSTFDEKTMFRGEQAVVLKEEFKDKFRNITRIMDCVGCEKCRLWGKIQTTGIGTALKVLFSYEDSSFTKVSRKSILKRFEVLALFNTLARFTESLQAIERFRHLYQARIDAERQAYEAQRQQQLPVFVRNLRGYIDGAKAYVYNLTCTLADGLDRWRTSPLDDTSITG